MTLHPAHVEELQDAVRQSDAVAIVGGATKSTVADPQPHAAIVNTTNLRGIVDYSDAECVLSARAGTPIAEIASTLAAYGQYLPFDPPFAAEGATLGGTVASGLSGPGRYRYGGVRDFVIGARVVDGEGRCIRSGGKVVKNAAGFLLHHALVGSAGAFGVITEITVKVFPSPEARHTIVAACGGVPQAFEAAKQIERFGADCEAIDFDHRGHLFVTIAGRRAALGTRVERLRGFLRSNASSLEMVEDTAPEYGAATDSWVRVAGPLRSWDALRPHVAAAQFMCAGSVAWLFTPAVESLHTALDAAHLRGVVIRGPGAGRRIGHWPPNVFEQRLRAVLDPGNRFRAASHPRG
jgi:glycolate oxidase FAD binding subunit